MGEAESVLPVPQDASLSDRFSVENRSLRYWVPRLLPIIALALGALLAYTQPALELSGGETADLEVVSNKVTFLGDGWALTLSWFGGILALIAALFIPWSERFVQVLAVTFGSLLALAFPYYVWTNQETINPDATGIGSGLAGASVCFVAAAVLPWLNLLVFNREKPILGRNWTKWLFVLPAMAWILLLTVFPLAYALTTSRYIFRNGVISQFVGWDNYRRLFQRELTWDPVIDAALFALALVAIIFGLSLIWKQFVTKELDSDIAVDSLKSIAPLVGIPIFVITLLAGLYNLDTAFYDFQNFASKDQLGILREPVDNALAVTVFFVAVAVFVEMILGFGLAVLMNRELRARSALRATLILPIFAASVGIGYLGRTIFYEEGGPVNRMFEALPLLEPKPWLSDPFWSRISTVIADVWQWTPFVFVIALAGLQSLPQDILEASEVDGGSGWQAFRSITLPLMAPILWLILLLRTIDAFKVFDIAQSMTVGGPGRATEYYSMFNYRTARKFFNYGDAAAQAFLLLFIVSVLLMVLWAKIAHVYEDQEVAPE